MTLPPVLPGHDDDAVLREAVAWGQGGRRVVLATVLSTWGSAPRAAGSHMAIRDDDVFVGSVSGGCIEGAVVHAARACLVSGQAQVLEFGIADETAWQAGLACGGTIRVLVAPLAPSLDGLVQKLAANQSACLLADLTQGYQPGASVPPILAQAVEAVLAGGNGGMVEAEGLAVRVYGPRWRLVVVGAVHIAQALIPMARMAGFEPILVDPRSGFAAAERFPGQDIRGDWPDEALAEILPDRCTALVALSHDPKLDDPALVAALNSPAFYVGALGSRRTHAKRCQRLADEAGLSAQQLDRIHAPVGLPLGGRAPGEIAISILAQIIAARYGA